MAGVDRDADIDCAATMSTASVKRRAAVENCGEAVVWVLRRGKNWELQRLLEFGLDQGVAVNCRGIEHGLDWARRWILRSLR
jgi:hypothetical protein